MTPLARAPRPIRIVSVVDRAACVLETFASDAGSLTLVELADRLSLPKPTAFRIATVLVRLGFLEQSETSGTYALGLTTLQLADSLLAGIEIRTIARPHMEALRDELDETTVLSLREGDMRYNIDSVESTRAIGQTQQIGVPIPLYAGAASRAILAALPEADVEDYLRRISLKSFSAKTIVDSQALRRKIVLARQMGHVASSGEFTPNSHAVARVIAAPSSYGLAALHVSIPPARYAKALERRTVAALRRAVERISERAFGSA